MFGEIAVSRATPPRDSPSFDAERRTPPPPAVPDPPTIAEFDGIHQGKRLARRGDRD
jgi:hypothetical protein